MVQSFQAPNVLRRPPEERAIAEIWSASLDRDGIGVHEDFFQLDGDSRTGYLGGSRPRRAVRSRSCSPAEAVYEVGSGDEGWP